MLFQKTTLLCLNMKTERPFAIIIKPQQSKVTPASLETCGDLQLSPALWWGNKRAAVRFCCTLPS